MEIWKDINGFEGEYQVSNFGQVKNVKTNKCLSPGVIAYCRDKGKEKDGYYVVNIKKKQFYIHRLVAETFIPKPMGKNQVNHIDCNKRNNYAENLEWVTASENVIHAYRNHLIPLTKRKTLGKIMKKHDKCRQWEKVRIVQLTKRGDVIETWNGIGQASRALGIDRYNISSCCSGKRKSAGGYVFKYLGGMSNGNM